MEDVTNARREIGLPSPIRRGIFCGLLRAASDWDAEILDGWINNGSPLGIDEPIACCGIFPPADTPQAEDESPAPDISDEVILSFENYSTMQDNEQEAIAEFERMLHEHHAVAGRPIPANLAQRPHP